MKAFLSLLTAAVGVTVFAAMASWADTPACCAKGNCCVAGKACCTMANCCKANGACCNAAKGVCDTSCGCLSAGCCSSTKAVAAKGTKALKGAGRSCCAIGHSAKDHSKSH